MGKKSIYINIIPKTVLRYLLSLTFLLLIANIAVLTFYTITNSNSVFISFFDFNSEGNIPTMYSSILLILSSILLMLIALERKRNKLKYYYWSGLALIFLFLAVDEFVKIHEHGNAFIITYTNTNVSGLLFYPWVIPYTIFLLIFIIIYWKFLVKLPKSIRRLFTLSGLVYVVGSIGIEILGGWQHELHGNYNITYYFLYSLEEFLEMVGINLFIYTLLRYLKQINFSLELK